MTSAEASEGLAIILIAFVASTGLCSRGAAVRLPAVGPCPDQQRLPLSSSGPQMHARQSAPSDLSGVCLPASRQGTDAQPSRLEGHSSAARCLDGRAGKEGKLMHAGVICLPRAAFATDAWELCLLKYRLCSDFVTLLSSTYYVAQRERDRGRGLFLCTRRPCLRPERGEEKGRVA